AVPANTTPADTGTGGQVSIADSGPMIVATVALPGCEPVQALAAFTDPAVLARWWRGELTADLVPGGQYSVNFPKIPARLVGRVITYAPGRSLEFSWAWDGEDEPPSAVTVRVEPADDGCSTVLTVEHGPHAPDQAGQKAHALHWEGWEYFLPRLPAAVSAVSG
ncbi:MAG TPA: SRPBCC domain-containing protein, partial [Streptosporangiaceae bacterium]